MDLKNAKVKDPEMMERAQLREKEWKEEVGRENEKSNLIAKILNFIGWLTAALSVIVGLFMSSSSGFITSVTTIATGVISGLIFVGFSEVIDLLQKIYVNTKK